MKRLSAYFLLLVGLLFTSCIPTKDLIYLQGEPSQSAQAVNPVVSKPYRLQVNDILNVTIKAIDPQFVRLFQSSESSQVAKTEQNLYYDGFVVDDHGNIRMPILNDVNVLGYTLEEARQLIEKRLLEEYFTKDANLFVSVKLAGFRYTINGEVAAPGTKTLYQEKVNLMEAVANAGDITLVGDRKSVTVIRQTPGGAEIQTVDLTKREAMDSPYFYLQPNDYVYVKPLPQKTLGTGTTLVQSMTALISAASLITTVIVLMSR